MKDLKAWNFCDLQLFIASFQQMIVEHFLCLPSVTLLSANAATVTVIFSVLL